MDCFSCPVCGQWTAGDNNHKCHPRTIAVVENRYKRELKPQRPPTYDERLRDGFSLLQHSEFNNALPQWA